MPLDLGLIVGRLFTREASPQRVHVFPEHAANAICRTGLSHLLTQYWGGYIAIVKTSDDGLEILRDPSAAQPCYYVEIPDGLAVASDADLLRADGFIDGSVDWPGLGRHLVAYDLACERTGLTGVKELLPGHSLKYDLAGARQRPVWSPWRFVRPEAQPVKSEHVRETIQSSVRAWASSFNSVLLGVSGGLDSSIIAACLHDASARLTCYTMATEQADGDERPFARLLARHLNLELHERRHTLSDIDLCATTTGHLPRPQGHAFGQSKRRAEVQIGKLHACDALFNGIGGDNVFCSLQSATPILDRLIAEPIGAGPLKTFNDICKLTGCSTPDALSMLLKRAIRLDPAYRWRPDRTFLSEALSPPSDRLAHPWLEAPPRSLPGKAVHIALLLRVLSTLDSLPRADPMTQVSPLLSQPIAELCLSVPTWRWFTGGMNRSLVREAFRDHLPPEIVQRRSKGGAAGFIYDVVARHKGLLREWLLDGLLVKAGLIDRPAIEEALRPGHEMKAPLPGRISSLAEAEAWARHWRVKASNPPFPAATFEVQRGRDETDLGQL